MSATIIDGKQIAVQFKEELRERIDNLQKQGIVPGLAVILVGDDPASQLYVKNKRKACEELGLRSSVYNYPVDISEQEILAKINELNMDANVHGILIQLPLPEHINKQRVIETIDPQKDVDCFHPYNFGQMALGQGTLCPCTPVGIIELLKRSDVSIAGKQCVVVGRSNLVGKPLSLLLLRENATVAICHSKTADLPAVCRQADILVVAVGRENLITKDMLKPGAVVIDVGMNKNSAGNLVGDVAFNEVKDVAGMITPVPGGVGPMTIAMLMYNVVWVAEQNHQ